MSACREYEPLLLDRLAGALDAAGSERLAAHLETCAPCRAEAAAFAEVLALAALPPPTPEEERALSALPRETLRALRHTERRSVRRSRMAVGLVALAAAAVAIALVPGTFRRPATTAGWQAPDIDTLWEASGAGEADGTADADVAIADESVALAESDDI